MFRKYDLYDKTAREKEQGPTLMLYDTVRERDIDLDADLGGPWPKPGSQGLRIKVMG